MNTTDEFNLIPVNDHILVKMEDVAKTTTGGIVLPNKTQKSYNDPMGIIVSLAAGEAAKTFPGKVGDSIMFKGGQVIMRGEERFVFVRIVDVIAVLTKKISV